MGRRSWKASDLGAERRLRFELTSPHGKLIALPVNASGPIMSIWKSGNSGHWSYSAIRCPIRRRFSFQFLHMEWNSLLVCKGEGGFPCLSRKPFIVEDEPRQPSLHELLTLTGYEVVGVAAGVSDALRLAKKETNRPLSM